MATKLQLITELSERTAHNVIKSPVNWTSFLKTAAWNYKYPFQDQLLIYAQRPDATACAPIELWNQKLGRYVNKGARGIALIDDSASRLSLRHVFDVSDTNSRDNQPVTLWLMQHRYAEVVTETLENTFGELEEKQDMASALISTVRNAVEDNFPDYLSDLMDCREDSFLEELDELNVEVIFKSALKCSVAYMLLVRCGYNAEEYLSLEDFQGVFNFNTLETVSRLGAATSDISEMVLREIGMSVKELQKAEKKQIRTIAKNQETGHNESRKHKNEGIGEHGTDLQDSGRLSDTRPDAAGGRIAHRQIWDVAQNISEKSQERNVRQPDTVGQAEQPSVGDRQDGEGAHRTDHGEALTEQSRTGQGDQSNGLDGTPKQSAVFSGGNGTGGAGLQLTLFPTVEQQIEAIEQAEDKKSFAFSISQEEIDHLLCRGTGVQNGKFRVYLHYQEQHIPKETVEFLKHEYGIGGGSHIFMNGTSGTQWHDGKGISLSKSGSFITNPDLKLTWNQVAKRLGELIAADRYLNSKEKEHLPVYAQQTEERSRQLAEEAYASKILNREPAPAENESQPLRDKAKYTFQLGDTVYLGADEYEIYSFNDLFVELRDLNCPIFTRQFQREAFEQMLRENPLNDHLIAQNEVPEQPAEEKEEALSPLNKISKVIIDPQSETLKRPRVNFHITHDDLGTGGQKTKYGWNIAAIRLLNQLEEEDRLATPEEQEILSRYVGWGGIPQVFDGQNSQWTKEYIELKALLTDEEYASARSSTLNAHFTSPTVIKAMYACLENMGFQTGNILEPACGVGNFFGLVPDSMKNSKLYGVELDSVTGRIARQLHQQANIAVQGFEETNLPDSFFDLAIGNVPFGSYGVADKKYDKFKFYIHDYFFGAIRS